MYNEGDIVAHAHHGIGVIRSIQEQEILGMKSQLTTLYFDRQGMEMIVPRKTLEKQVRDVMDETKAQEVLGYLEECHETAEPMWKKRQKDNQERLTSGDPLELCNVAKSLIGLQRSKGSLAISDQAQLKRSLEMLAEELATVLGGEQEQMMTQLERTCNATLTAA